MVPLKRAGATAALLLLAACAHAPRSAPNGAPAPEREAPGAGPTLLGVGVASFYGEELRGHRTANGERFDPDGFTAAHRTLAFGTCLRVQEVASGREVLVRVNDRGPYVSGRLIDLSRAAARRLGFVSRGVARVRLFRCSL